MVSVWTQNWETRRVKVRKKKVQANHRRSGGSAALIGPVGLKLLASNAGLRRSNLIASFNRTRDGISSKVSRTASLFPFKGSVFLFLKQAFYSESLVQPPSGFYPPGLNSVIKGQKKRARDGHEGAMKELVITLPPIYRGETGRGRDAASRSPLVT